MKVTAADMRALYEEFQANDIEEDEFTPSDFGKEIGKSTDEARKILTRLEQQGRVTSRKFGVNDRFCAFRIVAQE